MPCSRQHHIQQPAGAGERLLLVSVEVTGPEDCHDDIGFATFGLVKIHELDRGPVSCVDLGEGLSAHALDLPAHGIDRTGTPGYRHQPDDFGDGPTPGAVPAIKPERRIAGRSDVGG